MLSNVPSSTLEFLGIRRTNQILIAAKEPISPSGLMTLAEVELKKEHFLKSTELLNQILTESSRSHEAATVRGLIKFLREKEGNRLGPLTPEEGSRLKNMMDAYDGIARSYPNATPEKREALDAIFGPATFTAYGFNLDSVLNALLQLDASRRKALRGD